MIDVTKRLYECMTDPKVYRQSWNDGLHPSSASIELSDGRIIGGCHREIFYRWKRFEHTEPKEVDYVLATEFGNWLHEGIQDYLRRHVVGTNLVVLSAEQTFYDKKHLTLGTSDLFLMDLNTKEIFGVDIKTVGEYTGKKCINQPSVEALMQCAIYMDAYQQTGNKGQRQVDYWVILYVSRDENWDLKARKHGSMFRYMWQFWMKFENDHVVVYDQQGNRTEYPDITLKAIRKRNKKILKALKDDKLPDRDFEFQYTEEYIMALYKADALEYKKDKAAVEKWVKKGAKEGELEVQMGDKQCRFCAYRTLCYSTAPEKGKIRQTKLHGLDPLVQQAPPSNDNTIL